MTHVTDILALGMKLEVDDGASNAYAEVLNITKMTCPKTVVDEVKANYLNMGTFLHRYLPGMEEPGEFPFEQEFAEEAIVPAGARTSAQYFGALLRPLNGLA